MYGQVRFVIKMLCYLLSTTGLLYFLSLIFQLGINHGGAILTLIVSLCFLFSAFLLSKEKGKLHYTGKLFLLSFCGWLISFLLVVLLFIGAARPADIKDPDYVIILGAGLIGEVPGLTLQERLETGFHYLSNNSDVPVIVSGGQAGAETISEAEAMRNFLEGRGIPRERILMEPRSQSTMENFRYTSTLLEGLQVQSPVRLMIVTSDFHRLRAGILAKRNGFIAGGISAKTPVSILPANLLREYFALLKSYILDR